MFSCIPWTANHKVGSSFTVLSLSSFPVLFLICGFSALAPRVGAEQEYTDWTIDYFGDEPETMLLWKFDEPGAHLDTSPGGYLLRFADEGVTTGVPGRFGEGLLIEGPRSNSNDSFAQSPASVRAFNEEALTVEFWFQPLSNRPAGGATLSYFFDKRYSDPTGIQLILSSAGDDLDSLRMVVGNGERTKSLSTMPLIWEEGEWYHIAVTYHLEGDDGILRIYRDGELLSEEIAGGFGPLDQGTRFFRIGNRLGSNYGSVPGVYDNFRVSSRALEFAPEP